MNPIEEEAAGNEKWVNSFVSKTFFEPCWAHNALNSNENHYCISCEKAACPNCLAEGSHTDHEVIKIYRLVYMDVVSIDEITARLDCSKIQPYTSNGKLVLALSPLPHQGSGKLKPSSSCKFCARRLMHPDRCKFCSIACKYKINTKKPTKLAKLVRPTPDNGRDTKTDSEACVHRKKRPIGTSRRKGTPVRAPFF